MQRGNLWGWLPVVLCSLPLMVVGLGLIAATAMVFDSPAAWAQGEDLGLPDDVLPEDEGGDAEKTAAKESKKEASIDKSEAEAGSFEDFRRRLSAARISRTTRDDRQQLTGAWGDRKVRVEVPLKPPYLLEWEGGTLPEERLPYVVRSERDPPLWSPY